MSSLNTIPVRYVKGVGPRRADILVRKGIQNVEDLLVYFPSRYEDRTHFYPIARLRPGDVQTVRGEVLARAVRRSFRRRGFSITEVMIGDSSGRIMCTWFNQPYIGTYLKVGSHLIVYGKVQMYGGRMQLVSPEFEILAGDPSDESTDEQASLDVGRIVPVYPQTAGISQRMFRRLVHTALEEHAAHLVDIIPQAIRSSQQLVDTRYAIRMIHFPDDAAAQSRAYERLSFEEFLLFQIPLVVRKLLRKTKKGISHVKGDVMPAFVRGLPFELTAGQKKALEEIEGDMLSPRPMQRLLQGDVGSGKTVVAACAALIAVQSGHQAALMAPTEILARQHYNTLKVLMQSLPGRGDSVKICLLTGGLSQAEKDKVYRDISSGAFDIVVGTHALLQEEVRFKSLSLVIIDEQHKFGVGQRALLPQKGSNPDVLIMTATPIPRTLAITLYGDLDSSVILGLPIGRKPVSTLCVSQERRQDAYERLRAEVDKGNQAYIIYPVIEETPEREIAGAENMFKELSVGECRGYPMGLIHGRMKDKEQEKVMQAFITGTVRILVATTILEVGIDVPAATCMIIENAERFGLSQLHQLRGRIGRGPAAAVCILLTDAATDEAKMRVDAMTRYSDGFRIAEEDLKIRGPGQFFGSRQHGLTELKVGNPLVQLHLLKRAREEAVRMVTADPALRLPEHAPLRERLIIRFPEYEKFLAVG